MSPDAIAAALLAAGDDTGPIIDASVATITGAALLLIGTIVTVLFGRRSSRETTDLAAIRLLGEAQAAELSRVRDDLNTLDQKYSALEQKYEALVQEKRRDDEHAARLISNLRFYITDLLQYIVRETGHEPPAPRFPIE